MCCCSSDLFLALLAILFPPLPVWIKRGICSADSVINILLLILGYIPGLLHAWYIIFKYPEPEYEYESLDQEAGGGRVTYVVVQPGNRNANHSHVTTTAYAADARPKIQDNMSYGATATAASSAPAPAPAPAPAASSAAVAGPSNARDDNAGEGRSDGPPPSYAQVVAGDNKIQSQD